MSAKTQAQQTAPPKKPTIALTGGGSGGHITPLLSLARAIKSQAPAFRVIYIGLQGEKITGMQNQYKDFDQAFYIKSGKFRRYHQESFIGRWLDVRRLALNIRDFFRLLAGIKMAWQLLAKTKPDVVFLKGGFVGVPVAVAARFRKIPTVTHDSDAVAGLANRLVGRWASVHATGMPAKYYNYPPSKVRYVGVPVSDKVKSVSSSELAAYKRQLGVPKDCLVLLIAGGSLGSQAINQLILAVAPQLLYKYPSLRIFHVTGQANETEVNLKYLKLLSQDNQKKVKVLGFSAEFYKYSGAADLIVTRAGATTLAEFAIEQKACVVIPSPFLAGGHQLQNALELSQKGAVALVDQDSPPEVLARIIEELLDSPKRRQELAKKLAASAKVDSAKQLAEILIKLASSKKLSSDV